MYIKYTKGFLLLFLMIFFYLLQSFFGRTYNNMSSISECKNNGECVINKKNRTSCKACRLRKCVMVGMSKSGSRYGRRSNWFKIHCLLQEQNKQDGLVVNPSLGGFQLANILRPKDEDDYTRYEDDSRSEERLSEDSRSTDSRSLCHERITALDPRMTPIDPRSSESRLTLDQRLCQDARRSLELRLSPRMSLDNRLPPHSPILVPGPLYLPPPPHWTVPTPMIASPALEQEHPIDLSVKNQPRESPQEKGPVERNTEESTRSTTPLDLTKRQPVSPILWHLPLLHLNYIIFNQSFIYLLYFCKFKT